MIAIYEVALTLREVGYWGQLQWLCNMEDSVMRVLASTEIHTATDDDLDALAALVGMMRAVFNAGGTIHGSGHR